MSTATNPFTRIRELLQEALVDDTELNKLVSALFAHGPEAGETGTPHDLQRAAKTWLTVSLGSGPVDGFESNASWDFTRDFQIIGALPEGELDPAKLEEIELRIVQLILGLQQTQMNQAGVHAVAITEITYEDYLLDEQLGGEKEHAQRVVIALVITIQVGFVLSHSEIQTGAFAS